MNKFIEVKAVEQLIKDEIKEYAGDYRVCDIRRDGVCIPPGGVCAILVKIGEYDNTEIGVVRRYDVDGDQFKVLQITDEDRDDLREYAKSMHPKFSDVGVDYCTSLFVENLINYTEEGLLDRLFTDEAWGED